jgi:hypothetical protein
MSEKSKLRSLLGLMVGFGVFVAVTLVIYLSVAVMLYNITVEWLK